MFADEFENITGLNFQVISTVDHPYVSPPIRLLDSHTKLYEIDKTNKVCILNWDVSQPNNRTYRYDLQVDIGLLAKNKSLFLFKEGTPYALQVSDKHLNLEQYNIILKKILDQMINDKRLDQIVAIQIDHNYRKLQEQVLAKMISEEGMLQSDYTKRALVAMYALLERENVSRFIEGAYLYYYKSSLMNKWIPYCIENAIGARAFTNMVRSDVFGRKIFRSQTNQENDTIINSPAYILSHVQELVKLIRNNSIIPSIEMLYWSLELANKQHYGNDYGFFERYETYLQTNLPNQLTAMKGDGINYFNMKKDYSVSYDTATEALRSIKSSSQVKESRINSMFAFYILLGNTMKDEISSENIQHTKTVEIIDRKITLT